SKFKISHYFRNIEFKAYIYFLFFTSFIVCITIISHTNDLSNIFSIVNNSIFQVISISSSSGFVSDNNYYLWPSFLPII
ncbi:potassium transporter, partial [Francisella tularensis subsp. holarctica]|nr:potassium transporter [Francisella tularensis subsp. holarctica]